MSSLMPTYRPLPVAFQRGEGAYLYDSQNRRYLDGVSGIAVTNLGHTHPAVTEAVCEQMHTLTHTSNLYRIAPQEMLGTLLTSATGMEQVFFCNSGAEGNEAAIKLARRYGHERGIDIPHIIVLDAAFHGRTMGALAATGNQKIQQAFEPMLTGFVRAPQDDIAVIHAIAERNPNVVAVLLEPIQGEGGVRQLDTDYLMQLRALCDQNGWLLMFDEVQSGNGRCGALYAFQRLGVTPDVLVTAKGLGNGIPIGACMARGAAAKVLGPGDHGTTYGGNFIACSAAIAVINTLANERLWTRADPIREAILAGFDATLKYPDVVTEIRGLGLMIGIELSIPCDGIVATALEAGLLVNVTAGNTVRLLPPLIMSLADARILGSGVAEVVNTVYSNLEAYS
nr:aspartate aminotransferase family protein [Paraglaciecola sp.]